MDSDSRMPDVGQSCGQGQGRGSRAGEPVTCAGATYALVTQPSHQALGLPHDFPIALTNAFMTAPRSGHK